MMPPSIVLPTRGRKKLAHRVKKIVAAWQQQNQEWRDPDEVIGLMEGPSAAACGFMASKTHGPWWDLLAQLKIRLMVSREYEHLLLMMAAGARSPEISYSRLPHPSGIAVDRRNRRVYVASTRNPNQVFTFVPTDSLLQRKERGNFPAGAVGRARVLVPWRANFYPGSLYIHDLALIGEKLYASATGHNMIVELPPSGGYQPAWWPKCVAAQNGQVRDETNYIQLNAIAAGKSLRGSFFSASASGISAGSPRDPDFPVDRQGVVFSGRSGAVVCAGLTRPHSARLYQEKVWVDNSGYGEFGYVDGDKYRPVVRLPGWTRGLCFYQGIAFVGTSQVLPRFERFAPGLNVRECRCGVHAIDVKTAKVLASITWPQGNQIFAIEWLDRAFTDGLPKILSPRTAAADISYLFYAYRGTVAKCPDARLRRVSAEASSSEAAQANEAGLIGPGTPPRSRSARVIAAAEKTPQMGVLQQSHRAGSCSTRRR